MFRKLFLFLFVCYVYHSILNAKIVSQPDPEAGPSGGASGGSRETNDINSGQSIKFSHFFKLIF